MVKKFVVSIDLCAFFLFYASVLSICCHLVSRFFPFLVRLKYAYLLPCVLVLNCV